jgi:aminomethyltransferase
VTALRTPLYGEHVAAGAKLVDFAGWEMPLHYGSQIEEHDAVRRDAGMFDVSHMGVIDLEGEGTRALLRRLLANDVARLTRPGGAMYSCMLREDGGVIDDLIVYFAADSRYRLVVNAGRREQDLAWIRRAAEPAGVRVIHRLDLAMIAVQGPQARLRTMPLLPPGCRDAAPALPRFGFAAAGDWFVARTGYTGEDGFELIVPAAEAPALWEGLRDRGVVPVGLGARDTLRLEAGLALYGNDLDESHHPLESGVGWTVAFEPPERDFIGRGALETARGARGSSLVGLLLEERGVLRAHQPVVTAGGAGVVTSGTFSPTLGRSIALARVPAEPGARVLVEVRSQRLAARVVKPPFVRNGAANIILTPPETSP